MSFFRDFKPEIKLLLIVVAVSVVLAVTGMWLLQAGLGPSFRYPENLLVEGPSGSNNPVASSNTHEIHVSGFWLTAYDAKNYPDPAIRETPMMFLWPRDILAEAEKEAAEDILRRINPEDLQAAAQATQFDFSEELQRNPQNLKTQQQLFYTESFLRQ